jgi:hypothetical protein
MAHLVAIGGSDAGISAVLRARWLDPTGDVTVVVTNAFPNYSSHFGSPCQATKPRLARLHVGSSAGIRR